MKTQLTFLARAILSLYSIGSGIVYAQNIEVTLPTITVTASPLNGSEDAQILTPTKILSGNELANKRGNSLGDTLSNELGVSASSFGSAASRPIIRGLEGPRIKILENGMNTSDISSISNDHAVTIEPANTQQIEILRGAASLLYGSGAIGGLVNIVNDRIPTELNSIPNGQAEVRYSTADKAKNISSALNMSFQNIGLHLDGSVLNSQNYRIPGDNGSNTLANSFNDRHDIGIGASIIDRWGYIGVSAADQRNHYGIPTEEGSQIRLTQTRYDVNALFNNPFNSIELLKLKLANSDYHHTELDLENIPHVNFSNKSLESRIELTHKPIANWRGNIGIQTENNTFSALSAQTGAPDTVPTTRSSSIAVFIVEERNFDDVSINAGLRLENVKRKPSNNIQRSFNLTSYSVGGLWEFIQDYAVGTTVSVAERAPAIEELYSSGPHDSTATYDRGNPLFNKETTRNIEFSLQKTQGTIRWKSNLFYNKINNFIFGHMTGNTLDDEGNPGSELNERIFDAGKATVRGAEFEISYNLHQEGPSLRFFADTSRGTLDNQGNLPLQPATRFGIDAGYKKNAWQAGVNILHAQTQTRLASFESTPTPAYTKVDANLTYTINYKDQKISWFALAKNIFNQDIRLSTSLLKDNAPMPGRNFIVGVRTKF